jgi:NADH-quinone oxidoreductase subunit M
MKRDLSLREAVVVTPLIALILLLGFYPKPVIDVVNPAVKATLTDIKASDPAPTVAKEAGR